MELTELIRTKRANPERTWNIASSEHWYAGDDFWMDMITNNPVYREAMIVAERKLIETICEARTGSFPRGQFIALGPGDSEKEAALRAALGTPVYVPIDINENELALAVRSVPGAVRPIHAEFRDGLAQLEPGKKFVYLGATYSNLDAIDYDLLAAIDENIRRGDAFYVSAQTLPSPRDAPLLGYQYMNAQFLHLNKRMTSSIGSETGDTFTQFNLATRNLEIGSVVTGVSGTAREVGMRPGDKVITMLSHKPAYLKAELDKRFAGRYAIDFYGNSNPVDTPSGTYTSTFEGAILTKL